MYCLLTLNIQGLRSADARLTLFSWLNCFKPDFVCLQETHCTTVAEFKSWVSSDANVSRYRVVSSPGSCRSRGVALLFLPCHRLVTHKSDRDGRFVLARFSLDDSIIQIASLYGPNNKRDGCRFFSEITQLIHCEFPIFLCGDFNTVVDPSIDRRGCNADSAYAYNWSGQLDSLMDSLNLCDLWRFTHKDERCYTWNRPNGSQSSRLDMVWFAQQMTDLVSVVDILPFFRSDHSYVFVKFDSPSPVRRGRDLWRANVEHFKEEALINEFSMFWTIWRSLKSRYSSLATWWDIGKGHLRNSLKSFSQKRSHAHQQRVKMLQASLFHIDRRITNGESLQHIRSEVQDDLHAELLCEARGAQIRARIQWAEEGETSSKFFLRMEKSRGQRKVIRRIRRFDGHITNSQEDIRLTFSEYYRSLFTSQPLIQADQDFFIDSLERFLDPRSAALCEGPVSEEECLVALRSMANNKTPGVDGFPCEFYLTFWDVVGRDLVDVLNSCYDSGCLSLSQRTGVISLLFKKGDPLDPSNWRPISLLCVDYKILSKVLANRLLKVIGLVTSPDQTCGVPGRQISENIRLLQDVVEYANNNDIGGAILSLDQEKAFDRVEWTFMQAILDRMGFGPSFRSWVALLYTSVISCVQVNGFLSSRFSVKRGVRQGCPLSPLLYVLVAESLACAIRRENSIVGFQLPDTSEAVKLSQYADDTSSIVATKSSVSNLFSLFERYERASGAKLNMRKCVGLRLGNWRGCNFFHGISWTDSHVTVLGSMLGKPES